MPDGRDAFDQLSDEQLAAIVEKLEVPIERPEDRSSLIELLRKADRVAVEEAMRLTATPAPKAAAAGQGPKAAAEGPEVVRVIPVRPRPIQEFAEARQGSFMELMALAFADTPEEIAAATRVMQTRLTFLAEQKVLTRKGHARYFIPVSDRPAAINAVLFKMRTRARVYFDRIVANPANALLVAAGVSDPALLSMRRCEDEVLVGALVRANALFDGYLRVALARGAMGPKKSDPVDPDFGIGVVIEAFLAARRREVDRTLGIVDGFREAGVTPTTRPWGSLYQDALARASTPTAPLAEPDAEEERRAKEATSRARVAASLARRLREPLQGLHAAIDALLAREIAAGTVAERQANAYRTALTLVEDEIAAGVEAASDPPKPAPVTAKPSAPDFRIEAVVEAYLQDHRAAVKDLLQLVKAFVDAKVPGLEKFVTDEKLIDREVEAAARRGDRSAAARPRIERELRQRLIATLSGLRAAVDELRARPEAEGGPAVSRAQASRYRAALDLIVGRLPEGEQSMAGIMVVRSAVRAWAGKAQPDDRADRERRARELFGLSPRGVEVGLAREHRTVSQLVERLIGATADEADFKRVRSAIYQEQKRARLDIIRTIEQMVLDEECEQEDAEDAIRLIDDIVRARKGRGPASSTVAAKRVPPMPELETSMLAHTDLAAETTLELVAEVAIPPSDVQDAASLRPLAMLLAAGVSLLNPAWSKGAPIPARVLGEDPRVLVIPAAGAIAGPGAARFALDVEAGGRLIGRAAAPDDDRSNVFLILDGRTSVASARVDEEAGRLLIGVDPARAAIVRVPVEATAAVDPAPPSAASLLAEVGPVEWLDAAAEGVAATWGAEREVVALGLVARLYQPESPEEAERLLDEPDASPADRAATWARALRPARREAIEAHALAAAEALRADLEAIDRDPAGPEVDWASVFTRRDDLESLAFVLSTAGRGVPLAKALAAVDAIARRVLPMIEITPEMEDDPRWSAVAYEDPGAWWGVEDV